MRTGYFDQMPLFGGIADRIDACIFFYADHDRWSIASATLGFLAHGTVPGQLIFDRFDLSNASWEFPSLHQGGSLG